MIKWGIIGAGNIAHRFAKSLESVEGANLYAVANRTIEKADRFKDEHPCERAYGSYQALLDDKEVAAVYIALPHAYHYEWILKAMNAGKAVLCEKPATMNVAEMTDIAQLAHKTNTLFMEAMKSRFTPAYKAVKLLIEDGTIGELTSITTSLCRVFDEASSTYHFEPGQGGCLLDMGVYNLALIQDFIGKPQQTELLDYRLHDNGIELYVHGTYKAGDVTASIESAFDRETETVASFMGSKGIIHLYDFHRSNRYMIEVGEGSELVECPYEVDDFYGEIHHFVKLMQANKTESDVMSLSDSVIVAQMLDQLKEKMVGE